MNNTNEINKDKAVGNSYAEITYHKKYGYMGTSVWNEYEVREMLMHTVQNDNQDLLNSYMKELDNGRELTFGGNEVGVVYRIASEEDLRNAEADAREEEREREAFMNSADFDKERIERILNYLGIS